MFYKLPTINNRLSLNANYILKVLIFQYVILIVLSQSSDELNKSNDEFERDLSKTRDLFGHVTIPDETKSRNLSVINYLKNIKSHEYDGDTIVGFVADEIRSWDENTHGINNLMWFNTSNNLENKVQTFTELKIHKKVSDNENIHALRIEIYQILKNGSINDLQFVDGKIINDKYQGWITFNVFDSFKYWTKYPTKNYGFYITIVPISTELTSEITWADIGIFGNNTDDTTLPFLLGYYKTIGDSDIKVKRSKRNVKVYLYKRPVNAIDENTVQDPEFCSRKFYTVNFKTIGVNNVIAPENININYCSGECKNPPVDGYGFSKHAIYQTLARLENLKIPPACCAPDRLSSQSILYYTSEKSITMQLFKNISVESCLCQ